jgi:hypothetical protein
MQLLVTPASSRLGLARHKSIFLQSTAPFSRPNSLASHQVSISHAKMNCGPREPILSVSKLALEDSPLCNVSFYFFSKTAVAPLVWKKHVQN